MRVLCALVLAVAFCPFVLVGCDEEEERPHVTVSVWDGSVISSGFADYIDSCNPEYDIEWIVGQDSLESYQYQAEQGSLPDVILAKDFDQVAATSLADSLYTLDETELISQYSSDYLASIPCNSEEIRYLPAAADFEGVLINEYLFELFDIPVPVDRTSFIEACHRFAEVGKRGFVAGMGDSETCYEVLQGFAEGSLVSETEDLLSQILTLGNTTQNVSLDASAFDSALSFVGQLVDQEVIQASDMTLTPEDARLQFLQGSAAMLFISDGQASTFGERYNMSVRAIPFFGEQDSWAFVEPAFVGMVSNVHTEGVATTASDEALREGALEVLSSIMGAEAQAHYFALSGIDLVVSTDASEPIELPDALETLVSCLDEGRVRAYVPSAVVAQATGTIMQSFTAGQLSEADALLRVQELMQQAFETDKYEVVTFSEGVSNLFDEEGGNVAASDVAQVARQALDCDFFITSSYASCCPLYAGGKTATQLSYSVGKMPVAEATLTGAQIEELVAQATQQSTRPTDLPVTSGLYIEVSRQNDTYALQSIGRLVEADDQPSSGSNTVAANEGRAEVSALDAQAVYSVGIACYDWEPLRHIADGLGCAQTEQTLQELWVSAYQDGQVEGLPSYQDYFALV